MLSTAFHRLITFRGVPSAENLKQLFFLGCGHLIAVLVHQGSDPTRPYSRRRGIDEAIRCPSSRASWLMRSPRFLESSSTTPSSSPTDEPFAILADLVGRPGPGYGEAVPTGPTDADPTPFRPTLPPSNKHETVKDAKWSLWH